MVALKRQYDSEDDIPEPLQEFYVEDNGVWVLQAEGDKNSDDVRKALSARDNERKVAADLRKQIDDLKEKLGDFDPDRITDAKDALNKLDELETQKLIDEKKFEEAAEKKYQRQVAEMKRQIESMQQNLEQANQKNQQLFNEYHKVRVNEALSKEFVSAGIDPDFLDAAITMEARKWEIDPESRQPVPIEYIDGGNTKVTATGADGKPLTMQEHARTFLREKPKWALSSNGTNSAHQNGAQGNGPMIISADDARDHHKYVIAKERAEKAGVSLEVQ